MHFSFVFRKSIMITEFLENLVYWIICQLFGCPNANLGPLTRRHPQPPNIHQSLHSAWFGPYLTSNLAMKLGLDARPSAAVEIKPFDPQWRKYPTVPNSSAVDVGLQNAQWQYQPRSSHLTWNYTPWSL